MVNENAFVNDFSSIQTVEDYENFVKSTWTSNVNDEYRPIWAAAELAAEAGEVSGVAVKSVRKGKPLDKDKYKDELGDVLWSLTAAALSIGTDLHGLMYFNTEKLKARLANPKEAKERYDVADQTPKSD